MLPKLSSSVRLYSKRHHSEAVFSVGEKLNVVVDFPVNGLGDPDPYFNSKSLLLIKSILTLTLTPTLTLELGTQPQ